MAQPCASIATTLGRQAREDHEKLVRLIDDPNETLDPSTRTRIMGHIADAKFSDHSRPLHTWARIGANFVGLPHPSMPGAVLTLTTDLNSAEWHAAKHTAQGEWAPDTTTAEYLADVRASVLHPSSVLDVGGMQVNYSGSSAVRYAPRAAVRTDMAQARAVVKKATPKPGAHMLTVYAIDTHRIASAYQLESHKATAKVNAWSNHRALQ